MAYAPAGSSAGANPPALAVQPIAFGAGSTFGSTIGSSAVGGRLWVYVSTYTQATVGTSDFISDGLALGMKAVDGLLNLPTNSGHSYHRITSVGSTFISLSLGLMISSAS